MPVEHKPNVSQTPTRRDSLKGWVMVALTLIFVFLYVAALCGFIKPLADISIITRLEPIIFVIIGYYFGRLPAQANENTLKNEISRQTQKTDAAQQIKEKTIQEREVLEEKIKNVKIALTPQITGVGIEKNKNFAVSPEKAGSVNQSIETAVKILDS